MRRVSVAVEIPVVHGGEEVKDAVEIVRHWVGLHHGGTEWEFARLVQYLEGEIDLPWRAQASTVRPTRGGQNALLMPVGRPAAVRGAHSQE